jgi:predicted dehydrogenase
MSVEFLPFEPADPYSRQIDHFVAVARGQVDPLVSCTDGLRNMQLIEAVKCAGETGLRQELPVLFAVDF